MNDSVDPSSSTPHPPTPPRSSETGFGGRDPAELADLYAVGALSRAEAAEFESRVKAGDGPYVRELARVRPVMEEMLGTFEPVEPSAEMRERVMRRIGTEEVSAGSLREKWESEDEQARARADGRERVVQHAQSSGSERSDERSAAGITVLRGYLDGGGKWLPTGARGVKFRPLYADWRANRRTILLKMEPGAELPDHDHAGVEEVVMIQGDLTIGGTTLRAGDYIRNEPGAEHGVPRTEGGCVCIVISAYQPFPAASWLGMAWTVMKGLFGIKSKA